MMSAIFGILRFDGGAVNSSELERMAGAMAHRMPDGRKFMVDGAIGLGHGLMRVNQEDLYEAQPLIDREAGLTLVADCRIDNREELAATFGWSDAEIRDRPDSAFILAAYKRWGEACPEHLLGDFAFVVWDGRAKRLFLARDHMGQRFVHYHHGTDFFAFATEIKGVWASAGVPRVLSEIGIAKDLVQDLNKVDGMTIFEGICGVPGGQTLRISANGGSTSRTYWRPDADPLHLGREEDYFVERYRSVLGEAVACRLRRLIRPGALCFSGGFDSGAIAALAGPVVTAQVRKLIAVASVMAKGDHAPRDARAAVEACGRMMPHLELRYYVRERRETTLTDLDLSFLATDAKAGNNYVYRGLFSIARAAGARLVMDGHGGDYTLNYRGQAPWRVWLSRGEFTRLLREFRAHRRLHRCSIWQTLRIELLPALLPAWAIDCWRNARRGGTGVWRTRPIAEDLARRMLSSGHIDPARVLGAAAGSVSGRAWCLRVLERIRGRTRPGFALLAATHGLDYSCPFHDKRVVELGLAVPETLYVKDGRDRHLARRAFAGLLPRERIAGVGPNDSHNPDHAGMIGDAAPFAIEECKRLAANLRVRHFVDLAAVLRTFENVQRKSGAQDRMRVASALNGLVVARFVEWFERSNS
jgi:asparagine synthase (glutamine-hydrolysing)